MPTNNTQTIALAAGGTGGHIFPCMAVAKMLLQHKYKIIFITDKRFDNYIYAFPTTVEHPNFSLVYMQKITKASVLNKITAPFRVLQATFKLMRIFKTYKVLSITGFGSYVSLPAVIAGFMCQIPAIIHEQNTIMGLSNKIASIFACCVMHSFATLETQKKTTKSKHIFTGNPLREEIKSLYNEITLDSFFKIYDTINIVVLGGSQGATALGVPVAKAIANLSLTIKQKLCISHQVPPETIPSIKELYKNANLLANIQPFFGNIVELISAAHIVISRAGATTIAELCCLGAPNILVPYPFAAQQHQLENAKFLQNKGACILLEENTLTPSTLSSIISYLLQQGTTTSLGDELGEQEVGKSGEKKLSEMSRNLKSLAVPNADANVCEIIELTTFGKKISNFATKPTPNNHSTIGTS